jgi:Spy/CpxP family protein refolding chaperone
MRKTSSIMTALVVLFLFASYPVLAQHAEQMQHMEKMKPGMGACGIPNLTAEQVSKIQKLKLEFEKGMLPLRTKVQIMGLELRAMVAEGADIKKLEAKVDEVSKARADIQKKALAHHLQVRTLLTDEQKVYFDLRGFGPGCRAGCGGGGKGGCGMGGMEHKGQAACRQGRCEGQKEK